MSVIFRALRWLVCSHCRAYFEVDRAAVDRDGRRHYWHWGIGTGTKPRCWAYWIRRLEDPNCEAPGIASP